MIRYYTRNKQGIVQAHDAKDLTANQVLTENRAEWADGTENGELIGWPDAAVIWHLNCAGGLDIGIPQ